MEGPLPLILLCFLRPRSQHWLRERSYKTCWSQKLGLGLGLGLRVTLGSCFCLYLCVVGGCVGNS